MNGITFGGCGRRLFVGTGACGTVAMAGVVVGTFGIAAVAGVVGAAFGMVAVAGVVAVVAAEAVVSLRVSGTTGFVAGISGRSALEILLLMASVLPVRPSRLDELFSEGKVNGTAVVTELAVVEEEVSCVLGELSEFSLS